MRGIHLNLFFVQVLDELLQPLGTSLVNCVSGNNGRAPEIKYCRFVLSRI